MNRRSNILWICFSIFFFLWAVGWGTRAWLNGEWLLVAFFLVAGGIHLVLIWLRLQWLGHPLEKYVTMVDRLAAIQEGTATDVDIQIAADFIYGNLDYPTVSRADIVADLTKRRDRARSQPHA